MKKNIVPYVILLQERQITNSQFVIRTTKWEEQCASILFNSLTIEGYFPQTWEKPPGLERWAGETWSGKHTPPFLTNKTVRGENQRQTRWKENSDKSSPKNLKLFFVSETIWLFSVFFRVISALFPELEQSSEITPKKHKSYFYYIRLLLIPKFLQGLRN